MDIRLLTSAEELSSYDRWVKGHPHGTLWQSLEWKGYREALGRRVRIYAALEGPRITASALVVIDRTAFGLSTWDISRGPLGNEEMQNAQWDMVNRIVTDAKNGACISLFFSPLSSFCISNFAFPIRPSRRHQQPEATRILDLTPPEDRLLAQMKPKGRYNISVAQKHGVRVERSDDVDAFYRLLEQTGNRDGFGILPKRHYEAFLSHLKESFLLLAYAPSPGRQAEGWERGLGGEVREATEVIAKEKLPIAALLGVIWNGTGIYYYGASDYESRALMAPYLLQWEAMRFCKARGCAVYDLLGVAPPLPKGEGAGGRGGWGSGRWGRGRWDGISSFKEKFGGTVVTYPPERQMILHPVMNALLQSKRKIFG
ncbi:MAG: peptidoglycan bridge formation glycyltransferase FemA/FemB family protein [Candidatus Peribacteraceae bacterium]|jgi:lipid II:glycine glycyltransferase (peptidoglycan interpeptide bridge formation enzyme)